MNNYTTLHMSNHNAKFEFVLNGEGLNIMSGGSSMTMFATPEQLLEMADTIYKQHGEYQKEVNQKLGQEALMQNHKPELEVAV